MKKTFTSVLNFRQIFSMIIATLLVTLFFGEANASISISSSFGSRPVPQSLGIVSTSFGTQTDRLFRDGNPTTCSSTNSASTFSAGNCNYESYTFYAASTGCLTVDVTATDVTLYMGIYSGNFDPTNVAANCIGQEGFSGTGTFGCQVLEGQQYTLVVCETYPGGGANTPYQMTLDNVSNGTPVPVSPWWTIAIFVLIGTFIAYRYKTKINSSAL